MRLADLKIFAREVGFDAVGVAPAALLPEEVAFLKQWLSKGKNAGMKYMAGHTEIREDCRLLVENARSVIVTLTNYYSHWEQPAQVPRIARYAWGKDYHFTVKGRLRRLLQKMQEQDVTIKGRCFTDSAPILEHAWARRAGLGWQGKNTLFIHRKLGSFCFIGIIISTAVFDKYDEPSFNQHCGNCKRCLEACPTGALSAYEVDARKCISYHTIESKEEYPAALKERAGEWMFGCDICQEVCPWNQKLNSHQFIDMLPRKNILELTANQWREMNKKQFKDLCGDSPLSRAGLDRLIENIEILG